MTRFVCVDCTATGHLLSRGLFLNRAGVLHHIRATKACFAEDRGIKEIHVDALAGDVMAGEGAGLVLGQTFVTNLQVKQTTNTATILVQSITLVA